MYKKINKIPNTKKIKGRDILAIFEQVLNALDDTSPYYTGRKQELLFRIERFKSLDLDSDWLIGSNYYYKIISWAIKNNV